MKRIIRITSVLICIFLIVPMFATVSASNILVEDSDVVLKDQKVYSNATLDEDFADDRVIVVMDGNIGFVNRSYDNNYFGSIGAKSICNLTEIKACNTLEKRNDSLESPVIANFETNSLLSKIDTENFRQILLINLNTKSKQNVLDVIKQLEKIDGIVYAGPDYSSGQPGLIPNDLYYANQWGLNSIFVSDAWEISTGSTAVRVGVMDTGIADHPDLELNLVDGWDFFNENAITNDDVDGHGTHVAGIIGAKGNNSIGIAGIAWNVSIVPLQIINDQNESYISDVIQAITYATNNNISIINHSWWNYPNDFAFKTAIANYPGLYVCIAGNAGEDLDLTPNYPASFKTKNMISVANLKSFLSFNSSSNYGDETVHIIAPGSGITSCYTNSEYRSFTGTSMAAPHVAGVAALILSLRPNLTPEEVKAYILDNVDKVDDFENLCITGGRLNAYKAVRAATESETFVADANNDGKSDVILSQKYAGKRRFTVLLGKTGGKFDTPVITDSTYSFSYSDPAYIGDFNGDGYTDIIIHWVNGYDRQLLVYTGTGTGAFNEGVNFSSVRNHVPHTNPSQFFVDDVNGDGKDDFIVHFSNDDGNRCALVYKGQSASPYFSDATTNALTSTNEYRPNDPVFVGDFNGDGYADMLVQWANSSEKRQLLIYTGRADGTFNAGVNLSSSRKHIPSTYPTKFFVADVNGDGKDDFVVQWRNSDGKRCNLVYKGKASSPYFTDATTDAIVSTNNYIETDPVFVGDVNGDGRSDMIVHWVNDSGLRQLLIYTANADATYNTGVRKSTTNAHDPGTYAERMFVADVNGDGRDDFIVKRKNSDDGVEFLTYLGMSNNWFSTPASTTPSTHIPYYD